MPKSFQARVRYAAQKLDRFGRWGEEPYSRTFDDCFEQYDGPVVVAALMQIATSAEVYCKWWPAAVAFLEVDPAPQEYIAKGLAMMGGSVWEEWTKTAEGILAGATKSLRMIAKEMRGEANAC